MPPELRKRFATPLVQGRLRQENMVIQSDTVCIFYHQADSLFETGHPERHFRLVNIGGKDVIPAFPLSNIIFHACLTRCPLNCTPLRYF